MKAQDSSLGRNTSRLDPAAVRNWARSTNPPQEQQEGGSRWWWHRQGAGRSHQCLGPLAAEGLYFWPLTGVVLLKLTGVVLRRALRNAVNRRGG
jgi:hypothetical protein